MTRVLGLVLALVLAAAAQEWGRLDESGTGYQIRARYPKILSTRPGVGEALTALLEGYARKSVADFKKDFQDATQGKGDRVPWSLDLDYTLPWHNDRLMAVYFVGSSYTGGAHPNPFLGSFVLDLHTGRALGLAELFRGDYLQALSQYARTELARRDLSSDKDWIARGTAPQPDSFSVAYPTEKGFLLIFPPYQVAPYVAGPQEVLVPWKSMAPFRLHAGILD